MTNQTKLTNLNRLLSVVLFFALTIRALALPSTGSNNLMTTPGVSFSQTTAATLTFNAPDKAILNWNNFGSGNDYIAAGDTIQYFLPNAASSVLNIVSGVNNTTIGGTIESNAKVFILNPNGIIIGNAARIDTAGLVLSTVDNPFSAQAKFMENGTLPSQAGVRSAQGNTQILSGAIIASPNITILTKDITIGGVLSDGALRIAADGAVVVGASGLTTLVSGGLTIDNPTGTTTLGAPAGIVTTLNGDIAVTSVSGNITNQAGSRLSARNLTLNTTTGDITIGSTVALNVTANAKNVSVAFDAAPAAVFNGSATGNLTVTSPTFLTLGNVTGQSAGNYSFTSGATLTLDKVHLNNTGATSFTGTRVADTTDGIFVYGPTAFTATSGDVVITKANHSFGPLSLNATGNATVFENGATNLNVVNVKELALKTGEFFFQTPNTAALVATKLNLASLGNVTFNTGTIGAGGLTIAAGTGNVDLSRLSLATNLGGVAPVVTTTGTVTPPAQ
jgi:filamentous hemagglutinin family protein